MINKNYERILERIAKSVELEKEEIEKKVAEKRSKLSGLISKEGAAQLIASELGISFENEKLKIDELLPGMRNVNIIGKLIDISPVRVFKTKRGEESKVVNLTVADDSSNIKVVLWDTNHIKFIEDGRISKGSVVEISNGVMRDNEIHLGNFSDIKPSDEVLENVVTEKIVKKKNISDFNEGENIGTRAFIVQIFEPRFFNVCPECRKKVELEENSFICKTHGKVIPEKRAVITLVVDDGTGSIRAVFFHEAIKQLGLTNLDNPENLSLQKNEVLGKEMFFTGSVRKNNYFNNLEIIVDSVKEVNLDEVIKELEKN